MIFSYRPSVRASHSASVKNGCCTIFTIPLAFAVRDGFPLMVASKKGGQAIVRVYNVQSYR